MTDTQVPKTQEIAADKMQILELINVKDHTKLKDMHLTAYGRGAWTLHIPKGITENTDLLDPKYEYDVIFIKKNPQTPFQTSNLLRLAGIHYNEGCAFDNYR